ncbi:SDR family oxidoreductase [Alteraurantiacibacter aestuarii]|uniref:SDR family NAD(P)-dependent oxidoreductase n=1 Tax=Alteraurantiacibacter aestuarii TaxID=650004 RepID=A0A844ZJV6_9SPHN|nr:SDR family NAD(P)-dependent oxidoreductase [Alteraurantiacibacter aestuarii]
MTEQTIPRVAIIGATSAVAHAYCRRLLQSGPVSLVLAGRDRPALERIAADVTARGAVDVQIVAGEIGDPAQVPQLLEQVRGQGPVSLALIAYGVLGDQKAQQSSAQELVRLFNVNLVSAALWAEGFAAGFEQAGSGRLVIMGSVAGDRGRQSNYLYGASKAALERIAQGMSHRFAGNPEISVTLVKPGFIDTPMTDHIEGKGGPMWATPDKIATLADKAATARRNSLYAPFFWRWIMLIVRSLPVPIFHKTKL